VIRKSSLWPGLLLVIFLRGRLLAWHDPVSLESDLFNNLWRGVALFDTKHRWSAVS
jgi:hypothetical protein